MPSLAASYYGNLVASAIFWGIYTMVASTALLFLISRKNYLMALSTGTMYVLATAFFALEVAVIAIAFLRVVDDHAPVPEDFVNLWSVLSSAQITLQTSNTTLGDAVNVWRAYNVCDRKFRPILFPLILLAGNAFSGFIESFLQWQGRTLSNGDSNRVFRQSMVVFSAFTLAVNLASSILILCRVWALHRSMKQMKSLDGALRRFSLIRLLLLFIDSGLFYSVAWLIILSLMVVGSSMSRIFLDLVVQWTGIYRTAVIVLVSLRMTQSQIMVHAMMEDSSDALREVKIDSAMPGVSSGKGTDILPRHFSHVYHPEFNDSHTFESNMEGSRRSSTAVSTRHDDLDDQSMPSRPPTFAFGVKPGGLQDHRSSSHPPTTDFNVKPEGLEDHRSSSHSSTVDLSIKPEGLEDHQNSSNSSTVDFEVKPEDALDVMRPPRPLTNVIQLRPESLQDRIEHRLTR
ncbi:hypothetical protein BV25DRAFT_304512 [Artomyces pyxidatus]|uniref:Uncharacterized protein n=1 Tax=Artomyces pyxidatus TaxID=48021 RepID=A0ACB8T6H5_9AGAM|nr:hypothetical protein BV25DRAFT_304512 [Artomyces pyxidatus]